MITFSVHPTIQRKLSTRKSAELKTDSKISDYFFGTGHPVVFEVQ